MEALKAAKTLLGCYRTGEANDPEVFGQAVAAILSLYSPEIVQFVTDPRTGLPGRSKWMPSPSEVREACEARSEFLAAEHRYATWGEDRERQKDVGRLPPPREDRLTLDELKAKYGKDWGIRHDPLPNERAATKSANPTKQAMTADELREHYRNYDLGWQPKRRAEDAA